MSALDGETLATVAGQLGARFFRAGLMLGIPPHELDSIQAEPSATLWQMNMVMLNKWNERGLGGQLELAQALKRLGLGRLSLVVDPSVANNPGPPTFINPTSPDFSQQELLEIAAEVGEEWWRLGIYLQVKDTTLEELKHRNDEVAVRGFRCLWAWYENGESVNRETLVGALKKLHKGRLASRIMK